MKNRNSYLAAVAVFSLALQATAAAAQQPAAAAAAPAPNGPTIPGLCAFTKNQALGASKVGQYALKRLDQIAQQANAEVVGQGNTLRTDAQAVDAQRASLPQDQYEQKALELRQRNDALNRLAAQRQREVELTSDKAIDRIFKEMVPLVQLAGQERNCSVILDGEALILVAQPMDITPSVVTKLDAKLTEFAFDRERLEQQVAQNGAAPAGVAAPAAARPAAPAAANPPPRPAAGRGGR